MLPTFARFFEASRNSFSLRRGFSIVTLPGI